MKRVNKQTLISAAVGARTPGYRSNGRLVVVAALNGVHGYGCA